MNSDHRANQPVLTNYSKATLWLGIITCLIIPPFSIANLLKGHYILGLICFSFMVLLLSQCVMIRKNKYNLKFTLATLLPAINLYIFFQIYTHGIVGVFWSFPASMVLYFILPLRYALKSSVVLLLTNIPLIFVQLEPALAASIALALVLLAILGGFMLAIIEQQQKTLAIESQQKRQHIDNVSSYLQPAITEMGTQVELMKQQQSTESEQQLAGLSSSAKELDKIIERQFEPAAECSK